MWLYATYGFTFTQYMSVTAPDPAPISLEAILTAVLRDVAKAQHQSNKYSANVLAPQYQQQPILRQFPVPNALMGELEIVLKFTVAGSENNNGTSDDEFIPNSRILFQPEILLPHLKSIASRSAQLVISHLDRVLSILDLNDANDSDTGKKIDALQKGLVSQVFSDYVLNSMMKKLIENETAVVKDKLAFLPDEAAKLLMQVIAKAFLNNKDFDFVFAKGKRGRDDITPKFIHIVRNELKQVQLPKYTSANRGNVKQIMLNLAPPLEGNGFLSKDVSGGNGGDVINSSFIGTLTIKVDMRNYTWVIDVNNPGADTLLLTNN